MDFMNLDRNALTKIEAVIRAISDIIDLELDTPTKQSLLCTLSCIILERVDEDTRQRLFANFERFKSEVDEECGEI